MTENVIWNFTWSLSCRPAALHSHRLNVQSQYTAYRIHTPIIEQEITGHATRAENVYSSQSDDFFALRRHNSLSIFIYL